MELDQLKKFVELAEKNLKFSERNVTKQIYFKFSGGEPTLNPVLGPLVKWIKERGHLVSVTSNGGRTTRWWEEWGDLFDQATFSFHTEYANLSHFLEVVKLQASKCAVYVHLIAWPENFNSIVKAHTALKEIKNCRTIIKKITREWVDTPGVTVAPYLAVQHDWIERNEISGKVRPHPSLNLFRFHEGTKVVKFHPVLLKNANDINFKGWECDMGIKNLSINPHGVIFGAYCEQLCMGNINDIDNISWQSAPTICAKDSCFCMDDIIIGKRIN
jgi:organic radical activating enzyme